LVREALRGLFREDFVGYGVELADGLHRREGLEIGLDLRPLLRIFLCLDGGLRVCVVGDQVVLELEWDYVGRIFCDHREKFCIGLVGETVAARSNDVAGIEVAIGDVVVDGVVVVEDEAECGDGAVDALDVEVFGVLIGAFDGEELKGADFGQDVDEACVEMAADAGLFAVCLPVVVSSGLEKIDGERVEVGAGKVGGEVFFVEDGFGSGDVGQEAADGVAIDADRGFSAADDVGQAKAIGFEERFAEKRNGDFEADELCVSGGGEAELAELVDVEGELGLDVGVRVFGVVDGGTVSFFELGEFNGNGLVDGVFVTEVVTDVVRERADGEGYFIGGLGVVDEREDEVAGANVVGEVGEEPVAEGIVAEVLDSAAAVGVGVGLLQLGVGDGGELPYEEWADGLLPGEVDEGLMGLNRVGNGRDRREEQGQEGYRFEEGGAGLGANDVFPSGCRRAAPFTLYIAWRLEERVKLGRELAMQSKWVRYTVMVIGFAILSWAWYFATRQSGGLVPVAERRLMPELVMRQLDGGTWRMEDHRGQVVLVNYWASWCGPCWEETPGLIRLSKDLGPQGLAVVGVAVDEGGTEKVKKFVDEFHVPYPVTLPEAGSQMAYGMAGVPTTLLVDRQGRVAKTYSGAAREADFRTDVASLLAER
jgi:cytochrome c biogenesis protein CcmG/thiol:disulfide interchange protein DsbE